MPHHSDTQALHEMHWKPLEERWWREEVRQGRLIRPRLDVYLNYWLTEPVNDNGTLYGIN